MATYRTDGTNYFKIKGEKVTCIHGYCYRKDHETFSVTHSTLESATSEDTKPCTRKEYRDKLKQIMIMMVDVVEREMI